MDLPDTIIQNLMVLAAAALSGKVHQGEPEQMAELWGNVAQAKKYLADKVKAPEKSEG